MKLVIVIIIINLTRGMCCLYINITSQVEADGDIRMLIYTYTNVYMLMYA